MSQHHDQVWLTKDAYERLQAELKDLRGPKRQELVDRIASAREEGELIENSDYQTAIEEQERQEGRIRQIEDMLARATVGETPPDDGMVEPGMKVTVRFVDFDDTETFLFGVREMAPDDLAVYSPSSPLGSAINGKQRGDTVSYTAPNGHEIRVEIVEAVPYSS